MGLFDFFKGLFQQDQEKWGVDELASRLKKTSEELLALDIKYQEFTIPKRSGGTRRILSPNPELKKLQQKIQHCLLSHLKCHPAVHGFEKGRSIVTNALPHVNKKVVVRMDLKHFFESSKAERVENYFRKIGWNKEASSLLTKFCTYEKGLPQGAPTSPRLSTLINYKMDTRLAFLAKKLGADYTRYADDMTFSFAKDNRLAIHCLIRIVKIIVSSAGYELHQGKKLKIRRQHQCQMVTGLVVNQKIAIPRKIRRWLRAVEYQNGKVEQNAEKLSPNKQKSQKITLTPSQLSGWHAFQKMVTKPRDNVK